MMLLTQWGTSILLIALSIYVGVGQWWAIYAIRKRLNTLGQPCNYSMIPLVGGLIGAAGCLISPLTTIKYLWWLPLIIDPGCLMLFNCMAVFGAIAVAKRVFRSRQGFLVKTSDR